MQTNTKITYKNLDVTVQYKPNIKHSYIQIKPPQTIIIKTPVASLDFSYQLLQEKEGWITKQLAKLQKNTPPKVELQKEVLLFGEQLSLNTKETHYLQNKLQNLTTHSRSAILACYDDFYKYMAQEYITLRVVYFAQKMDLSFKEIRFKKMKSRWGSCSSTRVLTFNTQLMKVNKELIDYVVVHELAHLVHMNHSQAFHSLVACYLHNHKDLRKQLKTHALV